jgi:hypothetical protein
MYVEPKTCIAKDELQSLMTEELLRGALLLVYANKQDMPNALPAPELAEKLGLNSLPEDRRWHIQPCSAVKGEVRCLVYVYDRQCVFVPNVACIACLEVTYLMQGLHEGLDWVIQQFTSR